MKSSSLCDYKGEGCCSRDEDSCRASLLPGTHCGLSTSIQEWGTAVSRPPSALEKRWPKWSIPTVFTIRAMDTYFLGRYWWMKAWPWPVSVCCSPEASRLYPGLHPQPRGQQVEGGDSTCNSAMVSPAAGAHLTSQTQPKDTSEDFSVAGNQLCQGTAGTHLQVMNHETVGSSLAKKCELCN